MVVGSSPPESIKEIHNGRDIIITGFVEDVRARLSTASIMILPLSLGGGFRSRVVDIMAMGIPVIGTHNALDSVELSHKVNGFIADSNEEIANYSTELLMNEELRNKISQNCLEFVSEKYSLENTYGKLSKFYMDMD